LNSWWKLWKLFNPWFCIAVGWSHELAVGVPSYHLTPLARVCRWTKRKARTMPLLNFGSVRDSFAASSPVSSTNHPYSFQRDFSLARAKLPWRILLDRRVRRGRLRVELY
jgi:hypothetical protein